MLIGVKSNNINEFKIIDFEGILSIKEGLYLLKYRIKFNSLRKSYILLSKALITRRKINRFVNQIYKNSDNFIEKILEILIILNHPKNC